MKPGDLYDITAYGAMVADSLRVDAYREALRRLVRPGSTVVDLGTGTGLFALLACRYGARRVYAIEPAEEIHVARSIARDNGLADRMVFIQQESMSARLPEPADVVVSDLRGVLPFYGRHIPAIIDARRRFVARDGRLIPKSDRLLATVVEAPGAYDEVCGPWRTGEDGIDMGAARQLATQRWRKARIEPDQLLAPAQLWAEVDYETVVDHGASTTLKWRIERSGTMHGIAMWFDTTLAEGIALSNAPSAPELIYGNAFFPLTEPLGVVEGDSVAVTMQADLVGQDYIWRWDTTLGERRLRQSNFFGAALSPDSLRRRAADFVPSLSESARIDLEALSLMDGSTSVLDIARHLIESYPEAFADDREAFDRAATLSRLHSR